LRAHNQNATTDHTLPESTQRSAQGICPSEPLQMTSSSHISSEFQNKATAKLKEEEEEKNQHKPYCYNQTASSKVRLYKWVDGSVW